MKALLAAGALACVPALAHADDTFEQRAQAATRVSHVDDIVWALTAGCDKGDDVQQRQCKLLRERAQKTILGSTLLVDADADAFAVERWNPQKKSARVTLSGCIRCRGIDVDGRTFVVRAAAAGLVYDNARQFTDDATAVVWAKTVVNHRVQMLVKAPRRAGRDILLDIVGFRVTNPCDGSVVLANPTAAPVPPDKKACTADDPLGVASPDGVDALTPAMVETAMKPVVAAAKACRARNGIGGKTKLDITISGDGSVVAWEQSGDFDGTATGQCIATAMAKVSFPKAKKATTKIAFPLELP